MFREIPDMAENAIRQRRGVEFHHPAIPAELDDVLERLLREFWNDE